MGYQISSSSVCITGIGIVTALGSEEQEIWRRLMNGETASTYVRDFAEFRNANAAVILDTWHLAPTLRMKELTSRAVKSCLHHSGLRLSDPTLPTIPLVIGTSFGDLFHRGKQATADDFLGSEPFFPGLFSGPLIVSSACSSGSDAIAVGSDMIRSGAAECVVCGGVDILDTFKVGAHSALGTLAGEHCLAFDGAHDGTIFGEGAAFLMLESAAAARRRSSKVHGLLAAHGGSTDLCGLTSPDETGNGAVHAIERALAGAGLRHEAIDYINAHGSGTPVNDQMEAKVYQRCFSKAQTPISSTKGAFGHTLGATGAIEAIVTLWALHRGEAPPTYGLRRLAPEWENSNVLGPTSDRRLMRGSVGLSVTYGFGGANTALVLVSTEQYCA